MNVDTIQKEQPVIEKVKYEKPLFEEHTKKFFPQEIWDKFSDPIKSCMQCSGCHGCR